MQLSGKRKRPSGAYSLRGWGKRETGENPVRSRHCIQGGSFLIDVTALLMREGVERTFDL